MNSIKPINYSLPTKPATNNSTVATDLANSSTARHATVSLERIGATFRLVKAFTIVTFYKCTSSEDSLLEKAASQNNLSLLRHLEILGINFNTSKGTRAALIAADEGNLKILQFLEERGLDLNAQDPQSSLTATHVAAAKVHLQEQLEIFQYLIEKKAGLNKKNRQDQTPALQIVTNRYLNTSQKLSMLKSLQQAGADLNTKKSFNDTLSSKEEPTPLQAMREELNDWYVYQTTRNEALEKQLQELIEASSSLKI